MKFTHKGLVIKQSPEADEFYSLVVTAEELLQWADVPRKKADFMAGYQRDLLDRHKKVTEFLEQDPKNIIPGSIIVAIDSRSVKFQPISDCPGVVDVEIDVSDTPAEQRLRDLADSFLARLGDAEKASIEESEVDSALEDDDDESGEDVPPESYLALLTRELRQAAEDLDSLPPDRKKAVLGYVGGVTKPGLILDGQHRVFGAKDVSAFDVRLPVILMPGLGMEEQVFHFYVLNNKAKPLSPTELRGTISTSLSNQEIIDLYERFRLAGVTAEEARLTHRTNNEDDSPFRGLVDFGLGHEQACIPENVMHQIVGKFVKLPKKYKLLTDGVAPWRDDSQFNYRLSLFYAAWSAIRDKYPHAWRDAIDNASKKGQDGVGQILYKATMLVLQEFILNKLNGEMPGRQVRGENSPLLDAEDLKRSVSTNLHFIPEEFFTRPWQRKGLDTKEGREFLLNQLTLCEQKSGDRIGHLPLLKSKGDEQRDTE